MAEENDLVTMTIEVVASYVAHNNLRPEDVPGFIASTHSAIASLEKAADASSENGASTAQPAVSIRKSLASPNHILSLIDGKPYKTLKRHLAAHGLTPAQYRERFGLKPDYPMVARAYSEERRAVAERLGLGRKPRSAASSQAPAASNGAAAAPKTEPKADGGKGKPAASSKPAAAKSAPAKSAPAKSAPTKSAPTKSAPAKAAAAKAASSKPAAKGAAAKQAPTKQAPAKRAAKPAAGGASAAAAKPAARSRAKKAESSAA